MRHRSICAGKPTRLQASRGPPTWQQQQQQHQRGWLCYFPQIVGAIKRRLRLQHPQVRMKAAGLMGCLARAMQLCGEDTGC